MTPRQRVMKLADKLGATVEIDLEGGFTVRVEAPTNQHWEEGVHELVAFQYSGFDTKELWSILLDRMCDGTCECDLNECEWWSK